MMETWKDVALLTALGAFGKAMMGASYRSTDFEVHRNWLAITSSLPVSKWYYSEVSEWTLDYPPLFAWFERILAVFAPLADPKMLDMNNLMYASMETVAFQRGTVLVTELVLIIAVAVHARSKRTGLNPDARTAMITLTILNGGLAVTDHIHFQYNGMLLGLLVLSASLISRGHDLFGALVFATLLNLKHLFLSLGPLYFVFLLRHHCVTPPPTGCWNQRRGASGFTSRLFLLGSLVLLPFAASILPLLVSEGGGIHELYQLGMRLFPFGRGLCHAYWAPNAWVVYNLADKVLVKVLGARGGSLGTASMTGGLVGSGQVHVWLPHVTPLATVILSLCAMSPVLYAVWTTRCPRRTFVPALLYCSHCAFLFGYHVHEKAALTTLVPMLLIAANSPKHSTLYMSITNTTMCQLLPLLFRPQDRLLRLFIWLVHSLLARSLLPPPLPSPGSRPTQSLSLLPLSPSGLYTLGMVLLLEPIELLQPLFLPSLPFLPLMARSAYCTPGMFYHAFQLWSLFMDEAQQVCEEIEEEGTEEEGQRIKKD